jgi:hypothetical protein
MGERQGGREGGAEGLSSCLGVSAANGSGIAMCSSLAVPQHLSMCSFQLLCTHMSTVRTLSNPSLAAYTCTCVLHMQDAC